MVIGTFNRVVNTPLAVQQCSTSEHTTRRLSRPWDRPQMTYILWYVTRQPCSRGKFRDNPLLENSLCTYLSSVQCTPEKFENGALFLRLVLPSTLFRHENGTFRKCSRTRRIGKRQPFVSVWTFENGTIRKRWRQNHHWCYYFPAELIQNGHWFLHFQVSSAQRGQKILMLFQNETKAVFKFLRRTIDGAQIYSAMWNFISVVNSWR